jgi:hypothetical protein
LLGVSKTPSLAGRGVPEPEINARCDGVGAQRHGTRSLRERVWEFGSIFKVLAAPSQRMPKKGAIAGDPARCTLQDARLTRLPVADSQAIKWPERLGSSMHHPLWVVCSLVLEPFTPFTPCWAVASGRALGWLERVED